MINSRQMRLFVWFLALSAMSGCSWFGGDDEPEEIKPNPLPGINQEVRLEVLWNQKIGGGSGDRAIRLRPAILGGRVFAASADGNIKALTTDKGRIIWEAEVKDFYTKEELSFGFSKGLDVITGGVGAGGDLVVVGTGSGEILALNQSDGSLAWKSRVASEVLSQPQIDDDLVVVQSIDGKVAAYDAIDGSRKWVYTTNIPSLTLRGTATPIISGDVILVGFSSGRVALLERETGFPGLDHRVAVAQGDSDLERLVDIDGAMAMENGRLYAASFQGRIIGIDIASGRILWSEEASSVSGVGTGFGNVYLASSDSQISAYNADNGREVWRVDALLHRDITAPVAMGSYLAFTDFEGYLHLMAQSDGRFVGRRKIDGSGVRSGVVAEDGRLYAMSNKGSLFVLDIR
ncbi:MAG: outer membrane protein assembly factor BamB [Pseudomonadales bacterium]|nr:outer membrane protein assembly factor BamB [Pseudomonadales bacterium]